MLAGKRVKLATFSGNGCSLTARVFFIVQQQDFPPGPQIREAIAEASNGLEPKTLRVLVDFL